MLTADFQKLSVSGLVTLYQLDATSLGAGILYLHGHLNYEDWKAIFRYAGQEDRLVGADGFAGFEYKLSEEKEIKRNIIFDGITYEPVAIKSEGLEMSGDGKASSPSLAMANSINGVQGAVSAYCLNYSDFAGAKLTVITTLAKYLDASNFNAGNPEASDQHGKQIWYIEQKTSENASQVVFELSNPRDFQGIRIPCREINNYCQWAINGEYRGESCGYTGVAKFDINDNPTTDPSLDQCSGRLQGCNVRFGMNVPLPFGGFASSSLNN